MGDCCWLGQVTVDTDKAEVPDAFFFSVFICQVSQTSVLFRIIWGGELPVVGEGQGRVCLQELILYNSMGPDGLHPRILRTLVDVCARPLSNIFERSQTSRELLDEQRNADVTTLRTGLVGLQAFSLTLGPAKIMDESLLEHVKEMSWTWRWRRWLWTVSVYLSRLNHAWPTSLTSVIK